MTKNAIFIGATGQNVGKTTLCLGIMALLKKRFSKIGFIKPVGQRHVTVESGECVDKDVVLFKKHFDLSEKYLNMSPVLFPKGFTKDYLDGKYKGEDFIEKIKTSFEDIYKNNDYTLVEGTGHVGVGSITELNNAQVAKSLKLDAVLISSGGIGSAFDELALNRMMFKYHGVKVKGVILNRVLPEKKEMIEEYFKKALKRWDIPLLGCVPYNELLNSSSMRDFELLFNTELISGLEYRYHHFEKTHFVASRSKNFTEHIEENQLVITAATRDDVIKVILEKQKKARAKDSAYKIGMILTGRIAPPENILKKIKQANLPVLYTPIGHYEAMNIMGRSISKIINEDTDKVDKAISLVENNINLDHMVRG